MTYLVHLCGKIRLISLLRAVQVYGFKQLPYSVELQSAAEEARKQPALSHKTGDLLFRYALSREKTVKQAVVKERDMLVTFG